MASGSIPSEIRLVRYTGDNETRCPVCIEPIVFYGKVKISGNSRVRRVGTDGLKPMLKIEMDTELVGVSVVHRCGPEVTNG